MYKLGEEAAYRDGAASEEAAYRDGAASEEAAYNFTRKLNDEIVTC